MAPRQPSSGSHNEGAGADGTGATARPANAEAPSADPSQRPAGRETILVVEDETSLRRIIREILEDLEYRVLEASNGHEALGVRQKYLGDVHLGVTDVVMPGLGGREVVDRLTASEPDLRALYMSGYSDDIVVRRGVVARDNNFLQKPFTAEVLAAKVREVLDRNRPGSTGTATEP